MSQAGWKCEECRRAGLESKRRCKWLEGKHGQPRRVVWSRKGVGAESCPRGLIRGESVAWIEKYYVWKKFGGLRWEEMDAREVHAFLILERELARIRANE